MRCRSNRPDSPARPLSVASFGRSRLARGVARLLCAALLLESAPALAAELRLREAPRGWDAALAVSHIVGRTGGAALAHLAHIEAAAQAGFLFIAEAETKASIEKGGRANSGALARQESIGTLAAPASFPFDGSLSAFSILSGLFSSAGTGDGGGGAVAAGPSDDPYGLRDRPLPAAIPPPPTPPDTSLSQAGVERRSAISSTSTTRGESENSLGSAEPLAAVSVADPRFQLLSIPAPPADPSPGVVLAPIAGSYTRVFAFDACDATDPWKLYDPASPASSDLTAITPEIGFWLEAEPGTTLPLNGSASPSTTIPLCPGWNLVGYPSDFARPVPATLAAIAGKYLRVFGYDAADAEDPWAVYDVAVPAWANDLAAMEPGRGYWIYATEAVAFSLSNRAAPPEVSFVAPADLETVTGPVDVVGTVASDDLASWELYAQGEEDAVETRLATGTTPVEAGVLATFDPTLALNGLHRLRLIATDSAGQQTETEIHVVVEGQRKIGVFALAFLDAELELAGIPLQIVRGYDTRRRNQPGDFGFGWTLEARAGTYRTNGPAGIGWQIPAAGGPFGLPCAAGVETRGHRASVRLSDRELYLFRPRLTSIATTTGGCFATFGWEFVRGPEPGAALEVVGPTRVLWQNAGNDLVDAESFELFDPTKARLRTRDGRVVELDRATGVTSLADANGNSLTIASGAITSSLGKSITLERDATGRIARVVGPDGTASEYAYDALGDLESVTNPDAETTRFRYDGEHRLTEIEDPRGIVVSTNEFDSQGRLVGTTDALGKSLLFDHRLAENEEVIWDRLGNRTTFTYDERGNVVREENALSEVTLRTFDGFDQVTSETDPLGNTTTYAYDRQDLIRVTDPLGNTTRFTYDAGGRVLTVTDPRGAVTTNAYDTKGNLTRTTDPLGQVTSYTYNARGQVLTETDALGHVTTNSYGLGGVLLSTTDALGHRTESTYEIWGKRLSETTTRTRGDGTVETLVTRFGYSPGGRLRSTTAPDGTVTSTEYLAGGLIGATIDALGRRTSFTYDDAGRLTTMTYPDGTSETSEYDDEGRRTAATNRDGKRTVYEYDELGRLEKTIAPDGAVTESRYDGAGRLEESIDARLKSTFYQYDDAGRRTKVIDARGHETSFLYDAAGNQVAVTDAKGNTTSFVYDAGGRLIRTVYPDGTQTVTGYDGLARRISETDQAGKTTRFGYDALGGLTSVTDALNQVTSYAYDELGNRISQTDAIGHMTRFEYDALGRQTARTLPSVNGASATERFAYDAVGNRTARWDFLGRLTTYSYDTDTSRLLRRSYPDGSFHAFTYSDTGRRLTATDTRGITTYAYDDRDRLTSLTYPDSRQLEYVHDPNGNRTALTAHVGGQVLTTSYTYDDLSRLETVTDPTGKVYVHDYDANGNREALVFPNGVQTSYRYEGLNRLKDITTISTATNEVVVSFAYTLGPTGNRTKIVEHDGTTRGYQYDELYRLTDEHVTFAGATRWKNGFVYDPVGNRTKQDRIETSGSQRVVTYDYDARDRLLAESSGLVTDYGWDENGNQISKSGPQGAVYEWDFENRLTKVTLANGTVVEHDYDVDGTRVRTRTTPPTGAPATVDYLADPFHQTSVAARALVLSQIVAETGAGTGALSAYHVRGDDLLATLRPEVGNPTNLVPKYFHAEGIGSIRALTDELGNVADRYEMEAFGTLLSHQGDDPNAYLFAGEPLDPNSGFYYNRSRWLDPVAGRFASMDLLAGHAFEPESLHKYLYAGVRPSDSIDPTGLSELNLGTQLTTIALRAALSVQSTFAALRVAFLQGDGGAIGRLFRELGLRAQGFAGEVLASFPRLIIQTGQRGVQVGRQFIDFLIRSGNRLAYMEAKYALPRRWGPSLDRLVRQVNESLAAIAELPAALEGEAVVWTYAEPTLRQLRLVHAALGANAARVQFVHGLSGLYKWVQLYFRGLL
ncbi:MAG TPA: RHS repeat-associated core domain-containing protein [Thermoanaerobaculia bacterium]